MSSSDPTVKSKDALIEVDSICDAFESAWKSGRRPKIGEYLTRSNAAPTSTILVELIKIDLFYREKSGETPNLADYETDLPEFKNVFYELQGLFPTTVGKLAMFGHFRLIHGIGKGGFGRVWAAFDTKLKRRVALKVPLEAQSDRHQVALMLREAQSVAQVDHPGIARVYEQGVIDGKPYIASEFVDGVTLETWIPQNEITLQIAARVCRDIALALQAAHDNKVIHRDLKAANVLIDSDQQPKLVDFGLAKRLDGTTSLGPDGTVMGTVAYMSPEQARGDKTIDGRTDIYSLGVILYRLLTNRVPFKGNHEEVFKQIFDKQPDPPHTFNQLIPKDLDTICLKALHKVPKDRYQTAREFAEDLQRFLDDEPILGRRLSLSTRAARWMDRNRAATALIVLVCFGVLSLGAMSLKQREDWKAARQVVQMKTSPSGANVVFVPLHSKTGKLMPDQKVFAGRSPVETHLLPGNYLVVAWFDVDYFHEVYRYVPDHDEDEKLPQSGRHRIWRLNQDETIHLPRVEVFQQDNVVGNMVRATEQSQTWLDRTELTITDAAPHLGPYYDLSTGQLGPDLPGCRGVAIPEFAARCIDFDRAMTIAERTGKRLPDWDEFLEFLEAKPANQNLTVDINLPVTGGDRIPAANDDVIIGLLSNVAEFCMSVPNSIPIRAEGVDLEDERTLRGSPDGDGSTRRTVFGPLASQSRIYDPNRLTIVRRMGPSPEIGMRGARSARPRFTDNQND